jgi:hypothetical protein
VASTAYTFTSRGSAGAAGMVVAQADEKTETDKQVSSEEIKKYVAVYIAMQRDHTLTVEKAAASQGLTVTAFRELEERIEHDEDARDQARRALATGTQQTAPAQTPTESASPPMSRP